MKHVVLVWCFATAALYAGAQSVADRLTTAFAIFENDPQLKSGISSIYVMDETTGKVVFEKNGRIGLAPASTQKIITAAAAYELLGRSFRYQTAFGYYGDKKDSLPSGGLFIKPSGDPTLGSWRWTTTGEAQVIRRLASALKTAGLKGFSSGVVDERGWESEAIPGGWIWDDVGNYYGAGAGALNWRENQYDLVLKSGPAVKDPVAVVETKPKLYGISFTSQVTAGAKGSGDNSYIYLPVAGTTAVVRGTIPLGEDRFVISGAMPSPQKQFFSTLTDWLAPKQTATEWQPANLPGAAAVNFFHTEQSPSLDSIVYWFLKRSINLYGEALVKTIALKRGKTASAENGADLVRDLWAGKEIGIDKTELNLQDGSGLSPQNRVTTHAQVAVLQYAKKQSWFDGYFLAFPEYNGMKLKSGTIGGAKSFCGYHTSRDGKKYIVSFIANNYNGGASALVQKMYKVLDVLK